MARPKKAKVGDKVRIIKPNGYMQGQYAKHLGEVLELKEGNEALVIFNDSIQLSILVANLKVV